MKRVALLLLGVLLTACSSPSPPQSVEPVLLRHFSLDSLEGVRATTGVRFDPDVSSDEQGSLRVDAAEPMTVPLFEVSDIQIEDAVLIYQADLQSESLDGKAYLEMWLRFPGRGEFFSRGLDRTVTGTMSWMTVATPFFVQKGQRPDLIRLNLVVEGKGTVWIDNLRLLRRPLPAP
jgi:hypothetical protein